MSAVTARIDRAVHVNALTGFRALAAGWVVAYHLWLNSGHPPLALPIVGIDVAPFVAVGWLGVDLFFVLSGFVLTWQVLHDAHRSFARGTWLADAGSFLQRRVLRVYPAYLACLSVLLPLAWLGVYRTPPTIADVGLHLVMFHNMVARYVDSINGVFWSMPFEWQFYLLFPLFILPLVHARTRMLVAATAAVAIGMKLWSALQGPGAGIAQLPWRIDEFVAGMAAAAIAVRGGASARARARLTWLAALVLVAGAWVVGVRDATWWQPGAMPLLRAVWIDVTVASLLIGLSGSMTVIAAVFASRPVVWLGTISYSIYLWHLPALQLTRGAIRRFVPATPVVADFVVTIAVILAVSASSYYAIERPFHGPLRTASARWRDARLRLVVVVAWALMILAATAWYAR